MATEGLLLRRLPHRSGRGGGRGVLLVVGSVAASVACTGSHGSTPPRLPVSFVAAPAKVIRECRTAARLVGYAVPCPTRIPRGLIGTPTGLPGYSERRQHAGCRPRFAIVGVSPCRPLGRWKGWIAGSSEIRLPREHLVISASPRPIRSYAKVVNGPGWYPGARVDVADWVMVNGWRARWVFVPPLTNDGSAFAGHVVLVWTTGGHTYAAGFHDTSSRAVTREMDLQLVRHMRMVVG
jgi:hypothetical protein